MNTKGKLDDDVKKLIDKFEMIGGSQVRELNTILAEDKEPLKSQLLIKQLVLLKSKLLKMGYDIDNIHAKARI